MMYRFFILLPHLLSCTGASESGIMGGNVAKPHSRPYMVSLQHRGHHVCGGMLIHEYFVLTAAHCLKNAYPLTAALGAHNLKKKEKSCQKIQVAHYHTHPLHQNITQNSYDIMLLKLKVKAKLTKNITIVALPDKDTHVPATTRCSIAGWGKTNYGSAYGSDVLMEAVVVMQDNSECKRKWKTYFENNQMICTRTKEKKGFCQGDSGGPLLCHGKAQGIISYCCLDCADHSSPNVFMKVPFFRPWIDEVLMGYGTHMSLNRQA
uniref:trypsin n=1 Tax=Esox lucius TaxID=8010 RepID=A0A3P8YFV0_ESOLU